MERYICYTDEVERSNGQKHLLCQGLNSPQPVQKMADCKSLATYQLYLTLLKCNHYIDTILLPEQYLLMF